MNKRVLWVALAMLGLAGCDTQTLDSHCEPVAPDGNPNYKCEDSVLYLCSKEDSTDNTYWKPTEICENGCALDGQHCKIRGCISWNNDGTCVQRDVCAVGWNDDGSCIHNEGCVAGWNDDGSCIPKEGCVIGADVNGACKTKEGCVFGNNDDGSCIMQEGCVHGNAEDGSCTITAECKNGLNPDGTCYCDEIKCEQGCADNGLCACNQNTSCEYGCDANDNCLCPPYCQNGCSPKLVCCPEKCKYGCDENNECIKNDKCIKNEYNSDGSCANPQCIDQQNILEDGSCYCPPICEKGCYNTGRCIFPEGCNVDDDCNDNSAIEYCMDKQCYCSANKCTRLDANDNHLIDRYEHTKNQMYNHPCKTDSDCEDKSCNGDDCDLFCDSAIGGLCATKCTATTQCMENEGSISYKDSKGKEATINYHYICRSDGRCAPDTFVSVVNIPSNGYTLQLPKGTRCEDVTIKWGDDEKEDFSPIWSCDDDIIHNYSKKGDYVIQIKGKYEGFSMNEIGTLIHYSKVLAGKGHQLTLPESPTKDCKFEIYIKKSNKIKFIDKVNSCDEITFPKTWTLCNDLTCGEEGAIIVGELSEDKADMFGLHDDYYEAIKSGETSIDNNYYAPVTKFRNEARDKWFDMSGVCLFKEILSFGQVTLAAGAFATCQKLVYISALDVPIFENEFAGAFLFNKLGGNNNYNMNISNWDVSTLVDMKFMMSEAYFNIDINKWNVSNVENMDRMFFYNTTFNSNISDWDVRNVKNMYAMFYTATNFNQDISNWNTKNVKKAKSMFSHNASQPKIALAKDKITACAILQKWGEINKYFKDNGSSHFFGETIQCSNAE